MAREQGLALDAAWYGAGLQRARKLPNRPSSQHERDRPREFGDSPDEILAAAMTWHLRVKATVKK